MTPHALIAPARLAGQPLLRTQSDERLVDLVRAGNDGAFEAIVARYRRPLLRYCSRILSEGRAEDAVQQAFMRAYDSLRASRGEMQLKSWLYRIAHNCSLNALRDRSLDHDELSESIDTRKGTGGVERPDQAFEKHQRLNDVVAAVAALPERQRDAIVLRELEGRSYEEIATELGVSGGAVRQLLNRARNSLRGGVTAVTPFGLAARIPWGGGDAMSSRAAEICAGGAGSAILAKACATVIVTGAVVGGVATSPSNGPGEHDARAHSAQASSGSPASRRTQGGTAPGAADDRRHGEDGRPGRHGGSRGDHSQSGRDANGGEDGDRRESHSGPGTDGGAEDHSGSGDGKSGSGGDSGGLDNGTGSGESGSGGSDDDPSISDTSGGGGDSSGSDGSDSVSGSDSGSSGSGSSGSGDSGSGDSGKGTDDLPADALTQD